jgi:NAD(P)-dependent dehydrogenase (short-subunit alcohol dehydrogenase family)
MGASPELARPLAERFAAAGATIALTTATSDGNEAFELRRVARAVTESGGHCLVEGVDMSIGTAVQVTVRQVAKALGRIDVAVLAPNLQLSRPAERLSDAEWSKVIGVNLSAVFYACRAIAREMFRQPAAEGTAGQILVIARDPASDDGAAYRAASAGLQGLVEALQEEWRERGVTMDRLACKTSERDEDVAASVLRALGESG